MPTMTSTSAKVSSSSSRRRGRSVSLPQAWREFDWRGSPDFLAGAQFFLAFIIAITICAVALLNPNDVLRSRSQFRHWFPQFAWQLESLKNSSCTHEYDIYINGTRDTTDSKTLDGAEPFNRFVQPMVNCLLENVSEYIKYQLSSSQVMLGITPTITALLGASTEELCLFALIGRRRFMGLLLSMASPSIYTERAFKYQDGDKILTELENNHVTALTLVRGPRYLIVCLQYLAALAAIANIATLNWQLGIRSINSLNANTIFMPMLWSCLGVAAHLGGAVVFNMRARRLKADTPHSPMNARRFYQALAGSKPFRPSMLRNIFDRGKVTLLREWTWPKNSQVPDVPDERIKFCLLPETRCFTFLAWFHSVLIIFHIIFGAPILSGTTFIGPRDALGIMARYIMSVIICRIILVYELAVLQVEYKDLKKIAEDSGTNFARSSVLMILFVVTYFYTCSIRTLHLIYLGLRYYHDNDVQTS